jgi:hypothetical protein
MFKDAELVYNGPVLGSTTASAKQKKEDAKHTTQKTKEQAKQKVDQVNYRCSANESSVADLCSGCCWRARN